MHTHFFDVLAAARKHSLQIFLLFEIIQFFYRKVLVLILLFQKVILGENEDDRFLLLCISYI